MCCVNPEFVMDFFISSAEEERTGYKNVCMYAHSLCFPAEIRHSH